MAIAHGDGMVQVRCRIWGHYHDRPFTYTDPPESDGSQYYHDGDPSTYWWAEGNYSCDCNRSRFVDDYEERDHHSDDIYIDFIQPLEPGFKTLVLMESVSAIVERDYPFYRFSWSTCREFDDDGEDA